MPRKAINKLVANVKVIEACIKRQTSQPMQSWRIEGHDGLVLVTHPSGAGIWWFVYRLKGERQRKVKIGRFEDLKLVGASEQALEYRLAKTRGENPAHTQHKSLSFRELAERCLAEHPALAHSTRANCAQCLKADVYREIGDKAASTVTAADIAGLCRSIKARGHIVHAQRVKTTIGGIYRWAMLESLVPSNPAREVPNQQSVASVRDRVPTRDELRRLWLALDRSATLTLPIRLIIQLTILTGLRSGEIVGARIDELENGVWTIRGDVTKGGRIVVEGRMKSGRQQVVYLSRQARALFDRALLTCANDEYVFPAAPLPMSKEKCRSAHIDRRSVSRAMSRLCNSLGIVDLCLHDMRTAMTSWLDDAGVQESIQSAMLHHSANDVTSIHYRRSNRGERLRAAWQLWADHVEVTVVGNPRPVIGDAPQLATPNSLHTAAKLSTSN
ncbi:MAG: site-specific integrase [Hyphomicrobiaceae bacterium]|nr:site-specific integrase [Hyphomicrobiaceae bacterium]